ncbi:hypothetical protein KAS79_01875 [Candidatus Parcubacteria bacterium]|nr:hypothetical protein [Candidatus Parcubacteria bacterium]
MKKEEIGIMGVIWGGKICFSTMILFLLFTMLRCFIIIPIPMILIIGFMGILGAIGGTISLIGMFLDILLSDKKPPLWCG